MKITLEPYSGGVYTASTDAEHISEVIRLFKGLLVQTGYHPHNVDEYFHDEESWFNDLTNNSCGEEEKVELNDSLSWPGDLDGAHHVK